MLQFQTNPQLRIEGADSLESSSPSLKAMKETAAKTVIQIQQLPSQSLAEVAAQIQQLLSQLQHHNETPPTAEIAVLDSAMASLLQTLTHTDASARLQAVNALATLPNQAAILLLGHVLLNNPNAEVRLAAARALDTLCHENAVPALCQALETDTALEVRLAVLEILGKLSSGKGMEG